MPIWNLSDIFWYFGLKTSAAFNCILKFYECPNDDIGDGHSVASGVRIGDFDTHYLSAGLSLFSIDLLLCYITNGGLIFWIIGSGWLILFYSSA